MWVGDGRKNWWWWRSLIPIGWEQLCKGTGILESMKVGNPKV